MSVNEVRLVDCPEITDIGVQWLVALLIACRTAGKNDDTFHESECPGNGEKIKSEDIFTVKLTNCPQITEKSLMLFLKLGRKLELDIKACDIGFLPESTQLTERYIRELHFSTVRFISLIMLFNSRSSLRKCCLNLYF